MNKKRVALALAAALGVNTLMVTVGPSFGGQEVIAHAQESRLIIGSEAEKRLAGINIKTLKTHVETSSNNEVTLTFDGLTVDNVSDVSGTLSYTKFDERTNDTNGSVTLHWDSSTGKAKVSGMNTPGIYSGDVTVTYKNGDKETYNLTLRKTYEKGVLTADVTVGVGTIEVKNVKFGDSDVSTSSNETLELYLAGKSQPIDTINTSDDTKFTVIGMAEGQVYDLVYKKDGVEQGRTQILIVGSEKPSVSFIETNSNSNVDSSIESKIKEDYDVTSVTVSGIDFSSVSAGVNTYSSVFSIGGETIVSYEQSVGKDSKNNKISLGGPTVSATYVDSSRKINVDLSSSVHPMYNQGSNFIPNNRMSRRENTEHVLIGQVNVNINDQASGVILDASKKITGASVSSTSSYLELQGSYIKRENKEIDLDGKLNYSIDDNTSHGYNTVSIDFETNSAQSSLIGGQVVSHWANQITTTDKKPILLADDDGQSTNKKVTTSLIVVKDSLDGHVINSSFEKISSSEGKLVLSNGDKLLEGTDANTLARKLIVQGSSSVSYIEKDSDDNLVFRVQFNGQVPSSIRWTLDKLGSTIDVTSVDAVNFDGEVKPSNSNTDKLESYFEISAKFGSTVPTDASSLEIDNLGSTRVTFDQLNDGAHTISTKVTSGNYQGTYSAGIWVNKNLFTLEARDVKSVSNTSASLVIDANFFNTSDIEKVTGGVVQYSQKTTNGDTTTWSDWKDTTTNIGESEVKEDAITKTVTGLSSGGTYKFRVVYDFSNGGTTGKVYSNETSEITLPTSSSSSTITGSGSSSSTSGTSTGSTTVNVTTSNSTTAGTSASVSLPSGFRYDSGKTPVIVGFKYKDSNGNTVTESKEQYSNVTVKFENGQVVLDGLVPGKDYTEISVDYTDTNGNTRTLILKGIKTTSQTTLEDYLANVYSVVFGRPADESGYHFHLKNLKDEKVALREFLLNILNEKEFLEIYKTTESKIEALYNAIVARSSDEEGKKFWVDEYKKVLAVYGSESTALKAIADRMVNENELKEIADKMRVKW